MKILLKYTGKIFEYALSIVWVLYNKNSLKNLIAIHTETINFVIAMMSLHKYYQLKIVQCLKTIHQDQS